MVLLSCSGTGGGIYAKLANVVTEAMIEEIGLRHPVAQVLAIADSHKMLTIIGTC
jgi:hypothetical protein